jgi:hypothetical protein
MFKAQAAFSLDLNISILSYINIMVGKANSGAQICRVMISWYL